jgi:hypothetical protein
MGPGAVQRRLDAAQILAGAAGYILTMRLLRRHRSWLSRWLVVLLLCTQWVTAAYACPQRTGNADPGTTVIAMASMPDCDGSMPAMDPEQPQLCKAHCEIGQQSVQSGSTLLDVPVVMAHGGALMGVLPVARQATSLPPTRGAGPPTGTPPLYLSLLVLRN